MSLGDALDSAVLELLQAGPLSTTQLHEKLTTAGARVHHEDVNSAITRLMRASKVLAHGNGIYGIGVLEIPAAQTTESEMAKKICPTCKKSKPEAEFYANGYCKPCGRAKAAAYAAKKQRAPTTEGEPKAVRPKSTKPERSTEFGVRVTQFLTIDFDDANGKSYSVQLRCDQANALKEALGEIV